MLIFVETIPKRVHALRISTLHFNPKKKKIKVALTQKKKQKTSTNSPLAPGPKLLPQTWAPVREPCLQKQLVQNSNLWLRHGYFDTCRVEIHLEDHPMTCRWLITMVIVSPRFLGLWDPLQMAFAWFINGGDPNHVSESWDDLPRTHPSTESQVKSLKGSEGMRQQKLSIIRVCQDIT